MRQETGATIVAIVRADGKMKIAPSGDAEIKLGDSLIILGHPKALRRAEEFLRHIIYKTKKEKRYHDKLGKSMV